MKYLKKFNEDKEHNQDPEFVLTKIKEKYPIGMVNDWYNDEKLEWVPENEDSDWYDRNNNGEAQDVIITQMMDWFQEKYYQLSEDNFNKVRNMVENNYDFFETRY